MDAARAIAQEVGVASVTLTAVADRAGVHHSAMRRYFNSHKEVLLRLASDGWDRWADAVADGLRERRITPAALAAVLAGTLAADPLFCDLLANVPLHLEHDVEVASVIEFKRSTHDAITRMREAIGAAVPGLGPEVAIDVVTAANAMAATLWQATHPTPPLAQALQGDPSLTYLAPGEFDGTLTRLLTATCVGLMA